MDVKLGVKKQVRELTKKRLRTNINVLTYEYESTYVIKDCEASLPPILGQITREDRETHHHRRQSQHHCVAHHCAHHLLDWREVQEEPHSD